VAGPAALTVAKLHKLGERAEHPHRLVNKDAHDLYRLLRAIGTDELAEGYETLFGDPRSRAVAATAIGYLKRLFLDTDLGARMAGAAEEGVGDPATAHAASIALAEDLVIALDRRRLHATG
jgi:hypothetical protein